MAGEYILVDLSHSVVLIVCAGNTISSSANQAHRIKWPVHHRIYCPVAHRITWPVPHRI